MTQTVAIGGLGAIGLPLARALDAGVDGLRLIAVSARDQDKARAASQDQRGNAAQGHSGGMGRTTGLEPVTSRTTTWRSTN